MIYALYSTPGKNKRKREEKGTECSSKIIFLKRNIHGEGRMNGHSSMAHRERLVNIFGKIESFIIIFASSFCSILIPIAKHIKPKIW